jgi:hypothetical protein
LLEQPSEHRELVEEFDELAESIAPERRRAALARESQREVGGDADD